MTQETKAGDTVYKDPELVKQDSLIDQMMASFTERYRPSESPEGCDLKSTWEIADMFDSIMPVANGIIALALMDKGFKTTLVGNEFRWMLRPTY